MNADKHENTPARSGRRAYVPAVGPRLRKLLFFVFGLFALLSINALYLGAVTFLEWLSGATFQGYFYQFMFLGHLALGLLLILPIIIYGAIHISNAHDRPNRRAVKAGFALFTTALILLASGLVLTRGIPLIEVRDPGGRQFAYWLHVIAPLVVAWLFVLHRLAGKRINWRAGAWVAGVAATFAGAAVLLQMQDPRQWNVAGPESGEAYFFPSLARTQTGNFIPATALMKDDYCQECHADTHAKWAVSAHRFASFNNPAYLFSVRNTRAKALERDGNVQAARFCAGCHDLVPFFSGAFDDPNFDDVNHPTADAGITCSGCHAITHINSPRGNADYTIEEPLHYPFVDSEEPVLAWLNRFMVKAKPAFHKKTFLKPLHQSTEFCGACHKVHLPQELNQYRWLRGQNHYDSFLLSGVSGHGVTSFYYPPTAEINCNGCHMPLAASSDFGAQRRDDSGELKIHDHQFPSANTAIPYLLGMDEAVIEAHEAFTEGSVRVDLFALRKDGRIDGELLGPLRPLLPTLQPGATYLLETVVRTLKLGHLFTQGTADSNEVWLDISVYADDKLIGRSGGQDNTGTVDPWSHFVNAYVLDRFGQRIDRRNAEDIFTSLYNNQIPPGAADAVHYSFRVPETAHATLTINAKLRYRKFDTNYLRLFQGEDFDGNRLPIITIAEDTLTLPIATAASADESPAIPAWQRWNDYGIGLLRKRERGQLRQAEEAFQQVAAAGRPDGPLNLARVYIREGRLAEAVQALQSAAGFEPPAPPWSVSYFTGLVNLQNGFLDEAIENFRAVAETRFNDARARGFDFSKDYRLLNELAQALFERAKLERGEGRVAQRDAYLAEAADWFGRALAIDPENAEAHYGLAQIYSTRGEQANAAVHRALHDRYKVDDNARDNAVAAARRRDPAADHAANPVVIYDLQRSGNFELPAGPGVAP